jgi:hypothetical protein
MVEAPLAFSFSKTRAICDAFDDAWAFLQGLGSDLAEASRSLATRTILAKRMMADQGLTDVPELRDDAVAFLQRNPPPAGPNGFGRSIGPARLARRAKGRQNDALNGNMFCVGREMPTKLADISRECRDLANDARPIADAATDPTNKSDFQEIDAAG